MIFGSTALEVAIGMIFVYLLLSLLCSAVNEYIESLINFRGKALRRGIELLLNDTVKTETSRDLAAKLYAHGLVRPLYRDLNKLPSYIPARTFALALWNMAGGGAGGDTTDLEKIKGVINTNVPNQELKEALVTLIDEAQGDFEKARKNIEDWYDGAMDRVSGWYKRRVQMILLTIGIVAAALINADSIQIAKAFIQDDALRASVTGAASKYLESPTPTPTTAPTTTAPTDAEREAALKQAREKIQRTRAELDQLGLPLGWVASRDENGQPINQGDLRRKPEGADWLLKVFGLFLTGLAISQGAPFWFDVLNKFMVIRSTVKPKEKSPEEASKDKTSPKPDNRGVEDDDENNNSKS